MCKRQLIDIEELEKHLADSDLRVIDCRFDLADFDAGRRDYLAGHIPGAVFADLNKDLSAPPGQNTGRHPLPTLENASRFFASLGIDSATAVVVYDAGNGALAARAWWMLRWLGHDNVRLLNGGLAAWTRARLPLENRVTEYAAKEFVATVRPDKVITTDEILAAGNRVSNLNLFDARDAVRYAGKSEPIDRVAGHIPGAKNLPLTNSLDANGTWKTREERIELWQAALGNDRTARWVAMCGSGVTACHLAVSAVDAGFAEPRLYIGSWSEWITDPSRPIALEEA